MAASPIDAVLIHAVYLLNCASEDPDIRAKSLASLTHSLRVGDAIGAAGGGAPPRAPPRPGTSARRSPARARRSREALAESEGCELHLENTAGAGGTLGRSFEELARLLEAARRARERLGVCLDSCHLFASGYDIRTARGVSGVLREATRKLGRGRIRSLHLNDSQTPLGSNRDRHANIGDGELGEEGCAAFLSAPGLQRLAVRAGDPRRRPQGAGARGSAAGSSAARATAG